MKSFVKNVRISPKKLRVIAEIVRGQKAGAALNTLRFLPKKGADIMFKAISSAVANAAHNSSETEARGFKVDRVTIDKGIVYKRSQPISRGRSHSIIKSTSMVAVFLSK